MDQIGRLVKAFESKTLPKNSWTHEAHLLVAIWYVLHYDEHDALRLVREKISKFNDATGTPNTLTSGYHETLTRFWVTLAYRFVKFHKKKSAAQLMELLLQSPLSDRSLPLKFYSREYLFSSPCRLHWREPDLLPMGDIMRIIDTSVQPHFRMSDTEFETEFHRCKISPDIFTHEAHLRLAWIHLSKYGEAVSIMSVCRDIEAYVTHLGASDKYNKTLTVAAIKAVNHFLRRSSSDNFYDFIHEFPELKTSFRELLSTHYRGNIFTLREAKENFIEPDLSPFDELFMNEFPERLKWAIDLMNINPSESILEIGCGTGLLAELIASKLTNGHLCAIDKSGAILTKAKKRNAQLINENKVTFVEGEFRKAKIPTAKIDRVVAFNVGFFRKNGTGELRRIEKLMKKRTGALYVFYQDPGSQLKKATVENIERHLEENNFRVVKKHTKRFHDTEACCIVSRPA